MNMYCVTTVYSTLINRDELPSGDPWASHSGASRPDETAVMEDGVLSFCWT